MIFAGLIGASGWFYLANYAHTPFEATAASIVASLGVAVSDVVADSIVVEKVRSIICRHRKHISQWWGASVEQCYGSNLRSNYYRGSILGFGIEAIY